MSAPAHVVVNCSACATALKVPAAMLGKRLRCSRCNEVFTAAEEPAVPMAEAVPETVEDDNPFALPSGPPSEPRAREVEREPAPRRGARPAAPTGRPKGKMIALIAGGSLLVLLTLGLGGYAIWSATRSPTKPTETAGAPKDTPKPKDKQPERAKLPEKVALPPKMADATRERVKSSTVYVRTRYADGKVGSGSGFFAAAPGLVVTNAHVVGQSPQTGVKPITGVEVVVNSGLPTSRTFPATVLKADRQLDLALLRVEGTDLPKPLVVDDGDDLKETQEVYIFGFPLGENLGTNISVNISTISSIRRDEVIPWIQVSGGMHPGNSGGPLTDTAGRVIGVARAVVAGTQINMAIPGDVVHSFFNNAGDLIPKPPGEKK